MPEKLGAQNGRPTAEQFDLFGPPPLAAMKGPAWSQLPKTREAATRLMARLLLDPHPDVIARLLVNPRLTEDDVIRLAAKRPNRSDVLAQIARSDKWLHRPRVRIAIVLNPWTPPEVSAPMPAVWNDISSLIMLLK